jgi:hypothetical protein
MLACRYSVPILGVSAFLEAHVELLASFSATLTMSVSTRNISLVQDVLDRVRTEKESQV